MAAKAGGTFLIDPDNEDFARGISQKLPSGGQGCLSLFMGLVALVGLLTVVAVIHQWAQFALLSTSRAETQGQLLGRDVEYDEGATYYVTYRFFVDDFDYTVKESVGKATYDLVEDGQSQIVRYAPANPAIATIKPGRLGELPFLTLFCLFWNGVVLVVGRALVQEVLKGRKLVREGQQIIGEITHSCGRVDSDGDFVLAVSYRFRAPHTHGWIHGSDSQVRNDLKDQPLPTIGTPVHVVYLDDGIILVL